MRSSQWSMFRVFSVCCMNYIQHQAVPSAFPETHTVFAKLTFVVHVSVGIGCGSLCCHAATDELKSVRPSSSPSQAICITPICIYDCGISVLPGEVESTSLFIK